MDLLVIPYIGIRNSGCGVWGLLGKNTAQITATHVRRSRIGTHLEP